MITADWARHMARYNAWQNDSLIAAADRLDDAARQLDRGAFFGSIQRTFSHLLWGDTIWVARFDGGDSPTCSIEESFTLADDWDQRTFDWTQGMQPADCEGNLEWYSGAVQRHMSVPREICIMQIFNHQTHHRGQIQAMLTAAGARPGDTDLPFMPEAY